MNLISKSFLYNFLYFIANQLIKYYNPCQIHKDIDGETVCVYYLKWCCRDCKFLGPNGCTTKCLGCKLHLCTKAAKVNAGLYKVFSKMKSIARKHELDGIRRSKKEVMNRLSLKYNEAKSAT